MSEIGKLSYSSNARILSYDSLTQKSLKNSIYRLESIKFTTNGLVWVNIPDFYLFYFDSSGVLSLKCPVFIQKPTWPTIPLQSKIDVIKFCQYWNLPNSILTREILPIIKKNPSYLNAN